MGPPVEDMQGNQYNGGSGGNVNHPRGAVVK